MTEHLRQVARRVARRGAGEEGIALVAVVLVVVVASLMSIATAKVVDGTNSSSANDRARVSAVHAAEAGVDWALARLNGAEGDLCGWSGSVGSLPAKQDAPGDGSYTVTITDSSGDEDCGDNPNDLRRIIRSVGRDTPQGPVRVVEAEVQLEPLTGPLGFEDAIFSGEPGAVTIKGGMRVLDPGGTAQVYTSFIGETVINNGAALQTDYIGRGDVVVEGGVDLYGNVWADGDVTVRGGATVHGNIVATGTITVSNGGRVTGSARSKAGLPVDQGKKIQGGRSHDPSVEAPPQRSLPTPPISFSREDWPKPYRSYANCADFQTNAPRDAMVGTHHILGATCNTAFNATFTLTGDTAIVADGCVSISSGAKLRAASGVSPELWLIALGQCATNDGLTMDNGASISVPVFVYAKHEATFSGGVHFTGQVYADIVNGDNGFHLTYHGFSLPGFESPDQDPDVIAYTPKLLAIRQAN